jgi:hypothetical protein
LSDFHRDSHRRRLAKEKIKYMQQKKKKEIHLKRRAVQLIMQYHVVTLTEFFQQRACFPELAKPKG